MPVRFTPSPLPCHAVRIIVLALLLTGALAAQGQGLNLSLEPHWFGSDGDLWYRSETAAGWRYVVVDASLGRRSEAFDHGLLAAALAEETGEVIEADRLPIDHLIPSVEGSDLVIVTPLGAYSWDEATRRLVMADGDPGIRGIPFDRTIRPSRATGGDVHLNFTNRCDFPVTLFWIDGGGGRIRYAELEPGGRRRQHSFAGHVWLATDPDGRTLAVFTAPKEGGLALIDGSEPTAPAEPAPEPDSGVAVPSPDGRLAAFVRDHDIWLRDLETGVETRLSLDGCAGDTYRKDSQRARLVEMDYEATAHPDSMPDVAWSPDSRRLIAWRTRAVTERTVYMVESSPPDQLQPRLRSYPYLKPGDDLPVRLPHLFDVEGGRQLPLDRTLFPQPWEISDLHWAPDGSRCFFLYNQRGHQLMRVIGAEAATGECRVVVDESCATFFDYSSKTHLQHLDGSDELVWMSERDGWNHLYLYDRRKGRERKQITRGEWVVRGVDRIDETSRQVWFRASGIVEGEDPYHVHHCRVDLDGKNLVVLTGGDGTHEVKKSPAGGYFVDTWSRVDLPPRHVLRNMEDGSLVTELEMADISALVDSGLILPERFVAPGRDGRTPIHGIIHRPVGFEAGRPYPVLEFIYAGPHGQHVPKAFRPGHRAREMADRGFIVVQIDGMGTNWRHKAFHDVCWQNLLDGGFPDRIAWMRAAASRYPEMDLERVGIYGGSAGGQNTVAAMLTHGDFYDAGVADCGCHDNRVDKIWWNEQWMGYPIGQHYAEQSNVTLAHQLQGDLLLIVGELDHNVDPASTMQVVDALIKADRDFEMLVIPGAGHGAVGTPYGKRKRAEFFEEVLGAN